MNASCSAGGASLAAERAGQLTAFWHRGSLCFMRRGGCFPGRHRRARGARADPRVPKRAWSHAAARPGLSRGSETGDAARRYGFVVPRGSTFMRPYVRGGRDEAAGRQCGYRGRGARAGAAARPLTNVCAQTLSARRVSPGACLSCAPAVSGSHQPEHRSRLPHSERRQGRPRNLSSTLATIILPDFLL